MKDIGNINVLSYIIEFVLMDLKQKNAIEISDL